MRVSLNVLRRYQLLDVEDKSQYRHLMSERESHWTVLASYPRRIILWGNDLRRNRRSGNVAGRTLSEVMYRLVLDRFAGSNDNDIADVLASQVLDECCHQVGFADTCGQVEDLHYRWVIVSAEGNDQLL